MALTVTHKFVSTKPEQADPTIIGPNEWNDVHTVIGGGLPFLVSSDFIFTPKTPGGSLTVGSNTIVMSPLPPGVGVGDTLYISGGTGAAESVPVTGASTSSVIVTCANTHSGAWTIQSATAGIQEAINSLPNLGSPINKSGLIYIPAGIWTIYSTITIAQNGIQLWGAGTSTNLATSYNSGPIISITAVLKDIVIRDLNISYSSGTPSTNFCMNLVDQGNMRILNILISGFASGISFTGTTNTQNNLVRDCNIFVSTGSGIFINSGPAAGGIIQNTWIAGNGSAGSVGIKVNNGVGLQLHRIYLQFLDEGLVFDAGSGQQIGAVEGSQIYCDGFATSSSQGFVFNTTGTGLVTHLDLAMCDSWGFTQTGYSFNGNLNGLTLTTCRAGGNGNWGFYVNGGKNINFINCIATSNSTTIHGAQPGMMLATSNVQIIGGCYALFEVNPAANTQNPGIYIGASGLSNILIDGATVTPNTIKGIDGFLSTMVNSKIINCLGYNPVGQSSITVGGSPFTYTNSSSPATIYISGGTVSAVAIGSGPTTIATVSPCQVRLAPGESVRVTYSVAPTMVTDIE